MKKTIYLTCALILLALTARTAGSSNDSVKALLFTLTDSTTIAVTLRLLIPSASTMMPRTSYSTRTEKRRSCSLTVWSVWNIPLICQRNLR